MKEIINDTVNALQKGEVILYPTETIWGLGCDATNKDAVASIYSIKQRDMSKSMLILVDSIDMLKKYVKNIPEVAYHLIDAATRPLTIIYPEAINLPNNLMAGDGSIGIRITKNEFCKSIIAEFKKPIVSTSANITGQKFPLGYFDISNDVKISADYIVPLKLGEFSTSKSSDIIKVWKSGKFEIIR